MTEEAGGEAGGDRAKEGPGDQLTLEASLYELVEAVTSMQREMPQDLQLGSAWCLCRKEDGLRHSWGTSVSPGDTALWAQVELAVAAKVLSLQADRVLLLCPPDRSSDTYVAQGLDLEGIMCSLVLTFRWHDGQPEVAHTEAFPGRLVRKEWLAVVRDMYMASRVGRRLHERLLSTGADPSLN